MRRRIRRDLTRWESGGITAAQLTSAYPGVDLVDITSLHAQLMRLTAEPSPDPEATWESLRTRLPDREHGGSLLWRTRRAMVAAVAAAVLGGTSVAYAAGVEEVRNGVAAITGSIRSLLGGSSGEPSTPTTDVGPARGSEDEEDLETSSDARERGDADGSIDRQRDDEDDGRDRSGGDDDDDTDADSDSDEPDSDEPDSDEPDSDEPDSDEPTRRPERREADREPDDDEPAVAETESAEPDDDQTDD
jgi:hypothetical protein